MDLHLPTYRQYIFVWAAAGGEPERGGTTVDVPQGLFLGGTMFFPLPYSTAGLDRHGTGFIGRARRGRVLKRTKEVDMTNHYFSA